MSQPDVVRIQHCHISSTSKKRSIDILPKNKVKLTENSDTTTTTTETSKLARTDLTTQDVTIPSILGQ